MKIKNISIIGLASLALMMSACPAATNTNTNSNAAANKPANTTANSNANTNANSAANTTTNSTTNSSASTTEGDTINIPEAGITMVVPKGFKHSKDGEDIIIKTEDEGVDIRFTVPKDGDYEKILTDAAGEVDDYLKDVKVVDKGSETTVNGMKAWTMGGTATNEGEAVNWELTILDGPKKPVLVNIYAAESSLKTHAAAVDAFLKSVKKQ